MTIASAPVSHALRCTTGSTSASLAYTLPNPSTIATLRKSVNGSWRNTGMSQFGGLAARPDGSISASVACGGSEITLAHPATASASASIKLDEIRIGIQNNEVSIRGLRGQEKQVPQTPAGLLALSPV